MSNDSGSRDVAAFRPTERFSGRVENYARYRPGYPPEVLGLMREEMGLTPASVVADIGSGTGILARMFLENGNRVYGVEPNREMREAAERLLADFPGFVSLDGRAEATGLADSSVDFVTAAQAFHWFDVPRARAELRRILRPGGRAVILWNYREEHRTPFLRAYEELLVEFADPNYAQISEGYAARDALAEFFGGPYETRKFVNQQLLDYEALRGRLLSASYVPLAGDPRHHPMLERLRQLFDQHNTDGRVAVEYDTPVFYGEIVGSQ